MQRDVFIELFRIEQQILPSRYILIGVLVARGASFASFLPATDKIRAKVSAVRPPRLNDWARK
jgi:hypothetical protein